MAVSAPAERTRWHGSVSGVLLVLLVANVMSNRAIPAWAYVPWNLCVAAAITMIAVRAATWSEMGFTEWRRGLVWGGALFVLTTGVLLVALTIPAFHDMYHDRRVDASTTEWLYQAFLRIPLGTAVLEEVAFRAVLPGLFAHRWGVLRGAALASVCFGLWHVLPALSLNEVNPTATKVFGHGAGGVAAAVVFAVLGTTLAGLWWCWVRYKARSVLATVLAHIASNSVAYTIAFIVAR